jgi:hypothetical protein
MEVRTANRLYNASVYYRNEAFLEEDDSIIEEWFETLSIEELILLCRKVNNTHPSTNINIPNQIIQSPHHRSYLMQALLSYFYYNYPEEEDHMTIYDYVEISPELLSRNKCNKIPNPTPILKEIDCPICLESIAPKDIITTNCQHSFCSDCIDKCNNLLSCAYCRTEITTLFTNE